MFPRNAAEMGLELKQDKIVLKTTVKPETLIACRLLVARIMVTQLLGRASRMRWVAVLQPERQDLAMSLIIGQLPGSEDVGDQPAVLVKE